MFFAPRKSKNTVFAMFFASGDKKHGIHSVFWTALSKNTGIYAVSGNGAGSTFRDIRPTVLQLLQSGPGLVACLEQSNFLRHETYKI